MHGNGLRTAALLATFSAVILLIGGMSGGQSGLGLAFLAALAVCGCVYFLADGVALTAMRARPVSEVERPELHAIVRELSIAARKPMPRVYVSPAMQPNAFATGRGPRHATVCCTEGILRILDARELRGVVAHELSHVYNRDVLISSVAAGLATVITFVAQMAWFIPFGRAHVDDDDEKARLLGVMLMCLLGPVAAVVIQLTVTRAREYQADASGARLTGEPLALASALRKIEAGAVAQPLPASGKLASAGHLMIANPFRGDGVARLFSTHPSTAERVRRLEMMAGYPR